MWIYTSTPHSVLMCFTWFSSDNSHFNRQIFVAVTSGVSSEVGADCSDEHHATKDEAQ
jgi:hypothetical protein